MPETKPATDAKPSKGQVFLRRSISTVGLWVLIGFAVATESVPLLAGLIAVIGTLACVEFLGLLGLGGTPGWRAVRAVTVICAAGHLGSGLVLGGMGQMGALATSFSIPLVVVAVTVALLFQEIDPQKTWRMFLGSVFGFVYTAVLAKYMIEILGAGGLALLGTGEEKAVSGIYYLLFVLAATKFTDMGAYIVGSAIGKHKFIPHISPGKTWEGIVLGGYPFALLGGALIYHFFGDKMPALGWTSALVMSAVLATVAIVGDLAESVIKRCLEKKDSGAVLPGIGGVLDLLDSVLFTAPVFYYYLLAVSV